MAASHNGQHQNNGQHNIQNNIIVDATPNSIQGLREQIIVAALVLTTLPANAIAIAGDSPHGPAPPEMFSIITRYHHKEPEGPSFYQAGLILAEPLAAYVGFPRIMCGGKSCESVRGALESLLTATSIMVNSAWGQEFENLDL